MSKFEVNKSDSKLKYRKFIGPSQFAAAIGLDEYLSPEQLRKEIENGYLDQNTFATCFGKDKECVALYYYKKLYNISITPPKFVIDQLNNRIGGIGDGLIDNVTGLEIKCHVGSEPLQTLPTKYLVQMAGYMHLYKRQRWILMSCTFNKDNTLAKYKVFTVNWEEIKDRWENQWYPQLVNFVNQTKWKT